MRMTTEWEVIVAFAPKQLYYLSRSFGQVEATRWLQLLPPLGQRHPVLTRWSAAISSFIEHKRQEVSTGINRCRGKPQNGFLLSWACGFCDRKPRSLKTYNTQCNAMLSLALWGCASMKLYFFEECLGENQWCGDSDYTTVWLSAISDNGATPKSKQMNQSQWSW